MVSASRSDFTARQEEVLETAVGLLANESGPLLTNSRLARSARCSKESLYRWFGDREGLLVAVVTYQARKVRTGSENAEDLSDEIMRIHLELFATERGAGAAGDPLGSRARR